MMSSIAVLVLFFLILGNHAHQKETPKQSDTYLLKSTKNQTQNKVHEKKEDACQELENTIKALVKKLPKKLSNNEEEMKKNKTLILEDDSLKKLVIENNKCGANSASWLANIYLDVGLNDKANEYHKIVLDFAKKDNATAIANLCGYDTVATKEQRLRYCKIVINRENIDFKSAALFFLGQYYFDNNDGDNLIKLCLNAGTDSKICQNLYLFPLGDKLREEKKYKQAVEYYKKIEHIDVEGDGFVDYNLAEMYARAEGKKPEYATAILWYEKALDKNYNEAFRSHIMNNMCASHEMQNDYVVAFKCYKQAAAMGYALSQLNVAKQYITGHGTVPDYIEAYAWLTASIAQGLDDGRQSDAEKLKNLLTNELNRQDKTGKILIQAKNLAQQYYTLYVLHEKALIKKDKNIETKIKEVISIFKE